MLKLIIPMLLFPFSLQAAPKEIKVRVTVYYTGKVDALGGRLVSGVTAASDLRSIPMGATVTLSHGSVRKFVVRDTGPAVKSRKASKGKFPIVDVYFKNRKQAMNYLKTLPKNQIVTARWKK